MSRWAPDFDHYATAVDGWPLVVHVDLGARAVAPIAEWPTRVRVLVGLLRPEPTGLRSADEEPELADLEDDLVEQLGDRGAYVGRVTHRGWVEHVFYRDTAPGGLIVHRRPWSAAVDPDPEWAWYRQVLLPDLRQAQRIANRRRLTRLHGAGDPVDRPREVAHALTLPDGPTAEQVAAALGEAGFRVEADGPVLTAWRSDAPAAIDVATDAILGVLERVGAGAYEGWTSPSVR